MTTKRGLKRLQRQTQEGRDVVDKMLSTLREHGIRVEFAWELPDVLEKLLTGKAAGQPSSALPHRSSIDVMRRLAGSNSAAAQGTPQALSVSDEVNIDLHELHEEFGSPTPERPGEPSDAMLERYNAGQNRLFTRIGGKSNPSGFADAGAGEFDGIQTDFGDLGLGDDSGNEEQEEPQVKMSADRKREMMSQVLGRPIKPPTMGGPNTLKK